MSADPRDGIEKPDPREVARKVRVRRLKRRLKAAASLVIAAAAGTFLACAKQKREHQPLAPNPMTEAHRNLPAVIDAGAPQHDAAVDAAKQSAVDAGEHRKGMPVRDNLLE